MLKMKKMVMLVMMIIAICLVATMSFEVKATSDNPITIDNLDITGGLITDDTANAEAANAIATNSQVANSQATQVIQPDTNQTVTNSNENTLPQTGVTEDITVMFFIIVCIISAIYAYRKIKNYNIK